MWGYRGGMVASGAVALGLAELSGWPRTYLVMAALVGVVLVLLGVARRCWRTLRGAAVPRDAFGPPVSAEGVPMRCC